MSDEHNEGEDTPVPMREPDPDEEITLSPEERARIIAEAGKKVARELAARNVERGAGGDAGTRGIRVRELVAF